MKFILFVTVLITPSWGISDDLLSEVVNALEDGQKLVDLRPVQVAPEHQIETQKANEESKMKQRNADVFQEASKILVQKHGVEILDKLEGIDFSALMPHPMAKTETAGRKKREYTFTTPASTQGCITDDGNCQSAKNRNYRSVIGVCNNMENVFLGAANTPVQRVLGKPNYADGLDSIRKAVSGADLPSARQVSNVINGKSPEVFDQSANHFHMQFGQFVAHDLIFMPSSSGPSGETLDCSTCPTTSNNCAPIPVPADDKYFTPTTAANKKCMRMTRALNAQTGFGARQQLDQNTHFLDLSPVYGSSGCEASAVRSFQGGKLTVLPTLGVDGTTPVTWNLPPTDASDTNCQSKNPFFCFKAGDFRNTLQPGLIPMHVLFIEEHNRIADRLKQVRPSANDEELYQAARRILISMYQKAIYTEYLPKLLGQTLMQEYNLISPTTGNTVYQKTTNPSVSAEFVAAAFRFGHSQARVDYMRTSPLNVTTKAPIYLGSNIFYADALYETDTPKQMISGMLYHTSMSVDTSFSFPIRNQLFETRGSPGSGVDLISVNINRGRDVGLHPYVAYRQFAKLPAVNSWDDLVPQMGADRVNILKGVYQDVKDVDLYVGLLMERPMPGALIGPTGGRIIADQFSKSKFGDRFFYEHAEPSTRSLYKAELDEIRKTSLKGIICRFYGASRVLINQKIFDAFGSFEQCATQPDININQFVQVWP